jgi:hypothetical protein
MSNTTRRAEWDGAAPRPFTIEIPDSTLNDLRERLSRTRWPDQMEGATWEYGTDLSLICRMSGCPPIASRIAATKIFAARPKSQTNPA